MLSVLICVLMLGLMTLGVVSTAAGAKPRMSRKKKILAGIGTMVLAAAAFGGAIVVTDDGGVLDSTILLDNSYSCSSFCIGQFTINSTANEALDSSNINITLEYLDGKLSDIPIDYTVSHYEDQNFTTYQMIKGVNTSILSSKIVLVPHGKQLLTGVNVITVSTHSMKPGTIVDWNIEFTDVPTKVLGISKTVPFSTKTRQWATWSSLSPGASPIFEFENASIQNRSYDNLHNATFGTVTNVTGIVGSSAVQCSVASGSCGFNVSSAGDINPTTTQSIGFWANVSSNSTYILRKGASHQYYFFVGANGSVEFAWNNDGAGQANGNTMVSDSKNHCYVFVNNGANEVMYFDNTTDANKTVSGAISIAAEPMTAFSDRGGNPMRGAIDELFFSNASLTMTEIGDFCSKIPVAAASASTNLSGSYSFNESNQTVKHNITNSFDFNFTNTTVCGVVNFTTNDTNFTMVDYKNGILNWTANVSKSGNYSIKIIATDNCSWQTNMTFQLNVSNTWPNSTWRFNNQTFNHNQSWSAGPYCIDADNDGILNASNSSLFTFGVNGSVAYTGSHSAVNTGSWYPTLACSDTNLNQSHPTNWTLTNTVPSNTWAQQTFGTFSHGQNITFGPFCGDEDNDGLINSSNTTCLKITNQGLINFTNNLSCVGTWLVQIGCNDLGYNNSNTTTFTIANNASINNWSAYNQSINHNASVLIGGYCVDPDGDTLQYTSNSTVLTILSNGSLSFTAGIGRTGNYSVVIGCNDSIVNSTATVRINVTNTAPTISANWSSTSGYDTANLSAYCNPVDLDNDKMNISWQVRANNTVLATGTINSSTANLNVYNVTVHFGSNYTVNCSANDSLLFSGFTNSNITQILPILNATYNFTVYFAVNLSTLNFSASNLSAFKFNATNVSAYGQTIALPCYTLINNAPFTITVNASMNATNSSYDFGVSNSTNLTGANFKLLANTTKNITLVPASSNLSIYCYGTYRNVGLGQKFNNTVTWTLGGP